jgi:tetratricopeptide (TPR) repeat protein
MRKLVAFLYFLLQYALPSYAERDYAMLWQKGNEYYTAKNYDSAVACYEQIAAHKPHNADVYYNLGNAYYRLNRIGPAILNYQRALKMDPGNKDIQENLLLTQSRIVNHITGTDEIFFIRWWQDITHPVQVFTWSVIAVVLFLLIILYYVLRQFNVALITRLPVQTVFILGFLWCCFLILALVAAGRANQVNLAVVMQNDTPLMNNELKGKPIAQLPEGTTVTILDEKDIWMEVRIPDGRTGWVQNTLVDKI